MGLYVYNGSSWSSQATAFKLYNGSSWTDVTRGYVYNGSSWSQFYPEAPANTSSPTYSTSFEFASGSTLTSTTGSWTNNPTSYAYQWQKVGLSGSWSNISGATSSSYYLTASEAGYQIRCAVTATNSRGSTTAYTSTNSGSYCSPQRITGLTGSKTGSGSGTFSWNSSIGAGTNGTSALYSITWGYGTFYTATTNSTSWSFSGFSMGPNYYFYVAARSRIAGSTIEFEGNGGQLTLMNVYP